MGKARIITGDCVEAMAAMDEASVDAIVTDPPYGLGFMGKEWDGLPPGDEFAAQALRVLRPGGHLLAFGGTRTYHRLACALEDAGFEIRDCLVWLYGSGFPKSLNLNGDRQGWGTALKPAHEPIVLARKPLDGTVAANVQAHGTGALNVDGCRIAGDMSGANYGGRQASSIGYGGTEPDGFATQAHESGRWPANVLLDPEAAAMLDEQSGERQAGARPKDNNVGFGNVYTEGSGRAGVHRDERIELDTGGASRFFYCAKASRAEREAGLREAGLREAVAGAMSGPETRPDRPTNHPLRRNHHPTVKPIDLMRWLVRLVTPPGGTVLDPFTGSGTTAIAAHLEGFSFIGIEREAEYAEIARARIKHWQQFPVGTDTEAALESASAEAKTRATGQLSLSGGNEDE